MRCSCAFIACTCSSTTSICSLPSPSRRCVNSSIAAPRRYTSSWPRAPSRKCRWRACALADSCWSSAWRNSNSRAAEARQFLANAAEPGLNDSQLAKLLERTEGWITGNPACQFHAEERRRVRTRCSTSLTGSRCMVADFFAEEVLGRIARQDIRDFLLQTSVLDRLSSGAVRCGHAPQTTAGRCSTSSPSRAFFSMPLDDERNWYRYHPLVRRISAAAADG